MNDGKSKWLALIAAAVLGSAMSAPVPAAEKPSREEDLMNQAQAALLKGDRAEALSLANQAVAVAPANAQTYYVRGRVHAARDERAQAVADFNRALTLEPRAAEIYQLRGEAHFKLGHFKDSIADFDRFLEFAPSREPHHWQRGISYYYAGQYEKGRKQFESHQTVNPDDVENAVWHFLCVAKLDGADKAGEVLLPVGEDSRVPMKEVYQLFAGKASADDVLAAARAGEPSPAQFNQRMFYAHLYAGLYYEATGKDDLAREQIVKAAEQYPVRHYMGDVARVHAALLTKKTPSPAKP